MYPATGDPIVAVHIEREGGQYSIFLRRSNGDLEAVDGSAVPGGFRYPSDVLLHLVARGVSLGDAERYIQEIDPRFNAQAEVDRRSEADMAAWRIADHLKREQVKEEFRRSRGQE